MSRASATALIRAPRGARLCLALAEELSSEVGTIVAQAAWHPSRPALRASLETALRTLDVRPLADRREAVAHAGAMRSAVGSAMYWQEPDDVDLLLQHPELREALLPVAEAITGSPSTRWWSSPVDLTRLRFAIPLDGEDLTPESLRTDSVGWQQWRDELVTCSNDLHAAGHSSPGEAPSGFWWSTPSKAGVLTTTRGLPGLGAVSLIWEEDTADPQEVAVWPMAANGQPRVFEIDRPAAWVDLVRRYPLDTTGEHRGDWYRVSGRDGTWHTPDWAAVADDYDAVHLTVTGYLTTATRALDVTPDGRISTVLAGWNPDQTWWLNDAVTPEADPQHWTRVDELGQLDEEWQQTSV